MWQLTKLSADNICAFEHLDYTPTQNQATLLFGNNLDNDSQNSNGSGKSALIEALAIGLLGEPLRKVNADEIINDRFNEACVSVSLYNEELLKTMVVNRSLSRKSPQTIQILVYDGDGCNDCEEIKQATVADYNKYVLEQIGLGKEDILRNFILTARKYQSFLSSPDRDKKEIINRFSNGLIVDEAIEALHADIDPIQQDLLNSEKRVSENLGRVSALSDEIERVMNESEEHKASIQERINRTKEIIAQKRQDIRSFRLEKEHIGDQLQNIYGFDEEAQEMERSNADISVAYHTMKERLSEIGIPPISDYISKINNNQSVLQDISDKINILNDKRLSLKQRTDSIEKTVQSIAEKNEIECKEIDEKSQEIEAEIALLQDKIKAMKSQDNELAQKRSQANRLIANLEKQLAGVIECPKCHHEFTLADDVDVRYTRQELGMKRQGLVYIEQAILELDKAYAQCVANGKAKRCDQLALCEKKVPLQNAYNAAKRKLSEAQEEQRRICVSLDSANLQLRNTQEDMVGMRKKMFDEVFDLIDASIKNKEQRISDIDKDIDVIASSVASYEDQISELEKNTEVDLLKSLKESQERYKKELVKSEKEKETVESTLNVMKIQEQSFVEFKTYLANTKIDAISQITNDFLEAIGSDIRVSLSGYTLLKSGKIRDKISVSLIRDGVDCGSFDKFSAGEKCRVELASVLALHKLSNVNCEEGKGLNLLVIDEILDCTDEAGLANVFKALNDTQVTALVVSHGNIAENYPNRLVVTKQNGVSTINGKPA